MEAQVGLKIYIASTQLSVQGNVFILVHGNCIYALEAAYKDRLTTAENTAAEKQVSIKTSIFFLAKFLMLQY